MMLRCEESACLAGILEDVTIGSSPIIGLVGALFFHFGKEDL